MSYYRNPNGRTVVEADKNPQPRRFIEISKKEYERIIEFKQAKGKIKELKQKLAESDYKAIKFAEGELSEKDFAPFREERKRWREEINRLESLELNPKASE